MKIKICGIRRLLDLSVVENAGADFLGFINVIRSKRYADLSLIKMLKSQMQQPHRAFLIMAPNSPDEAIETAMHAGINNLQFHSLSPPEIREIKKRSDLHVTRAIGLTGEISAEKKREIESFSAVCDAVLFDYELKGLSGGTGKQIPIEAAVEASRISRMVSDGDVFLAGGINSSFIIKNKLALYKNFQGLDINSGVEKSPGNKDEFKIKQLMDICR